MGYRSAGLWRDTLALDLPRARHTGKDWTLQSESQEGRLVPLERPHVNGDSDNKIFRLKMILVNRCHAVGIQTVEYAMLLRRASERGVYRRMGMVAHEHPISWEPEEH